MLHGLGSLFGGDLTADKTIYGTRASLQITDDGTEIARLGIARATDVQLLLYEELCLEQNLGQLAAWLRSRVDGFVPYQFNEVKGQPFVVSELVNEFEQLIKS